MAKSRSPRTTLFRLFDESRQPVFVVNVDRRIVFANPACGEWLGCNAADLIGLTLSYQSGDGGSSLVSRANAMCPSPELFSGGVQKSSSLIQLAGKSKPCVATFFAIQSGATDSQKQTPPTAVFGMIDLSQHQLERAPVIASENAMELHAELRRVRLTNQDQSNRDLTVGQGSWTEQVNTQTRIAARSNCNVLISGEAGTGRRELAEKIHATGARKHDSAWLSQLIPIDCPRLEPLSLQKLFTETVDQVRSLDQKNHPCFLMLDIDQLDSDSQLELSGLIKLSALRFRLIAISDRDKSQLLNDGKFETDLAREIAPLEIAVPPLRKRREDIPLLAQMFLEDHNAKSSHQLAGFTTEALDELVAYDWPGNVVQFEQFVKQSCECAVGDFVTVNELPKQIKFAVDAAAYPKKEAVKIDLDSYLAEIESDLIQNAIDQAGGNKTRAAELLGITRARLHRKLEERSDNSVAKVNKLEKPRGDKVEKASGDK